MTVLKEYQFMIPSAKKMARAIYCMTLVAGTALLAGCMSSSAQEGYYPTYREASLSHATVSPEERLDQLDPAKRTGIENFMTLFADITQPGLADRIADVYADEIYFNDTLHTFTLRSELSNYLASTAEKLDFYQVNYDDLVVSGENVYIRWTMENQFTVLGNDVESTTIGITQVRVDENGKVVFHQDFWDSTEGIFRHIPMVGYFIGKAREQI